MSIKIEIHRTGALGNSHRESINHIVSKSFEAPGGAEPVVAHYCRSLTHVALAIEENNIVGFQFFSKRAVKQLPIVHFSMAARMKSYSGLQRVIGRQILNHCVGPQQFVLKFGAVGVCNHPATYHNMGQLGGSIFPNVHMPGTPCFDRQLYLQLVTDLGLQSIDIETGIIENRASNVGLKMLPVARLRDGSVAREFGEYVNFNLNRGVLVLVVTNWPLVLCSAFIRTVGHLGKYRNNHE
jgi:hypothetical protein